MSNRSIPDIARDIRKEWGVKVYFGAKPYLGAMCNGDYGLDGEKSVVLYFLSNAASFQGERARALKAELKQAVGVK